MVPHRGKTTFLLPAALAFEHVDAAEHVPLRVECGPATDTHVGSGEVEDDLGKNAVRSMTTSGWRMSR
jgi:hypothetical protein